MGITEETLRRWASGSRRRSGWCEFLLIST